MVWCPHRDNVRWRLSSGQLQRWPRILPAVALELALARFSQSQLLPALSLFYSLCPLLQVRSAVVADAVSSSVVRLTLSVFWFGLVKRAKRVSVAWYSAWFMQASEARDVLRSSFFFTNTWPRP